MKLTDKQIELISQLDKPMQKKIILMYYRIAFLRWLNANKM